MLAIIGGTGLSRIDCFGVGEERSIQTPFSSSAVKLSLFNRDSPKLQPLVFLPRHLQDHSVPPHRINYRANIWALRQLGVKEIVAVNAVGAIDEELEPGSLAVPHQLIDYSYGRDASYFETGTDPVTHIDFTHPYDHELRQRLLDTAHAVNGAATVQRPVLDHGVYGCTQGPRLETAAEIVRLRRDGCDMVGMTGMPEAALARELDIAFASLAVSVNWAAGVSAGSISLAEIHRVLDEAMGFVAALLQGLAAEPSATAAAPSAK